MFEVKTSQFDTDFGQLLAVDASQRSIGLSVIVPVMNEHDNVVEMINRLGIVLAEVEWEVIFVDDNSSDGTPELVESIAAQDRRVRLIRRFNRRGLASAVIEGMCSSTAPVVAVIDGDLQHDEAILVDMYQSVRFAGHDLAIGSRYMEGGSFGDWKAHRKIISQFATRLAEKVAGARVSDPMSGFFAVSRDRIVEMAPRLSGIGYKILLDVMSSAKTPLKITEIPYTFRTRQAGESKLDSAVAVQYLEMLWEKKLGRFIPLRFMKFAAVGSLGLGVHMGILAGAMSAGAGFDVAQIMAVTLAIAFNFFVNNAFTYRDCRLTGSALLRGLVSFYLICAIGAAANVGAGIAMFANNENWLLAGATGALVGSIWNYVMGSTFTWKKA